eukprot:557711-Hanusia_phi.AAC.2
MQFFCWSSETTGEEVREEGGAGLQEGRGAEVTGALEKVEEKEMDNLSSHAGTVQQKILLTHCSNDHSL